MTLTHKVALVTGAASGIGRATALALAEAGADVAVNDISPRVAEVAAEVRALGRQAWAYPVDVTDQHAVEAMVAGLPRLDVFVSSAVFSEREPFTTANMHGFRKTIDVSMWGAFYCLRAVTNRMLAQGGGGAHTALAQGQALQHPRFGGAQAVGGGIGREVGAQAGLRRQRQHQHRGLAGVGAQCAQACAGGGLAFVSCPVQAHGRRASQHGGQGRLEGVALRLVGGLHLLAWHKFERAAAAQQCGGGTVGVQQHTIAVQQQQRPGQGVDGQGQRRGLQGG